MVDLKILKQNLKEISDYYRNKQCPASAKSVASTA